MSKPGEGRDEITNIRAREQRRKGAIERKAHYFEVEVFKKEKRRVEAGEVERKSIEVQVSRDTS